ncbi:hypothetical protein M758_4G063700 [Ceratodon purpureus]|uniref:Uncharacterized protein n=1 Tax=Ceratodon purpureus TaxID=3225 RepID=A0A8T0I977_CERPU|nr:hypothetical protein KC19_4G066000 [Ceratodon purpureus]KAG0618430.1 hypothetical protein M758_4G063700 [Ceratodon purpureus]
MLVVVCMNFRRLSGCLIPVLAVAGVREREGEGWIDPSRPVLSLVAVGLSCRGCSTTAGLGPFTYVINRK